MRVIRRTVVEAIVLGVIGIIIGFGVNEARPSGGIILGRNYFDFGTHPPKDEGSPADSESPGLTGARNTEDKEAESDKPHPKHPYQVVSFDKMVEIFEDPYTEMGANVFIDSRNRELYEEGHIPGAIQADHYHLEEYVDAVLAAVEGAERVITYCEGGDCEDSIFMCTDLQELGVPFDIIYIYSGGWKEWSKNDMPIVMGAEPR